MSTRLNDKYVSGFVSDSDISAFQEKITAAHNMLHQKNRQGQRLYRLGRSAGGL